MLKSTVRLNFEGTVLYCMYRYNLRIDFFSANEKSCSVQWQNRNYSGVVGERRKENMYVNTKIIALVTCASVFGLVISEEVTVSQSSGKLVQSEKKQLFIATNEWQTLEEGTDSCASSV